MEDFMNSIEAYEQIVDEYGSWENYLNSTKRKNQYICGEQAQCKEMKSEEKQYNHTHLIDILKINSEMLIWARLNEGYSLEDASEKLKEQHYELSPTEISDMERGIRQVKLQDLQELAVAYRRPLAVFFFPKPPKQDRKYPVSVTINYNNGETTTFIEEESEL